MRQRLLSPASPRQAYGSASPPRPSFISRWFSYGGNLKRFQRTPAERMLLRWVACWVMMAAVATIVMLFLLFQVNSYPVLDKNLANIIRLQRKLTREGYSDTDEVSKTIIKAVSSKNIETTVRHLITGLHSGLHQDDLVKYVKKTWLKQGLDSVEEVSFNVLMSMPDPTNGNKVELYKDGALVLTAANQEVPAPGSRMAIGPSFYAYSAATDIKEPVMYVNYATKRDFDYITRRGLNAFGKICIARIGQIPRREKVQNVEKAGGAGLLLFLDPEDVGPRTTREGPYPNSWWVGGSAMERGSVAYVLGDPLTPGYPSRDGMYRIPQSKASLPRIPCQPIGYDDARKILSELVDHLCPKRWVPKLQIPCNIDSPKNIRLRLAVHNKLETRQITNVIGIINGTLERDRIVLVGNHMDSISTHSAADPFLGISQLLEVTRVFGMLHKEGWTSQRSVVFALWDGEEQGILGSTEWVEENMAALRSRAVIYIGTKMLTGDKFHPMSSPAVSASVRGAASLVPHYKKKGKTLLDMWAADSEVEKNSKNRPMTWPVMGRSDDAPFAFSAGVPTAFLMFLYRHNITNLYPAYHTAYDTLELVEKYLDPKFRVSRMSVQLIASLVRLWADRRLLPYELRELAFHVRTGLDTFIIRHGSDIATHNLDMSAPLKAARYLSEITEGFMEWTMRIRRLNPLKIRIANDIMMEVEKLFINPGGIPTRDPTLRNLVFAPEGVLFPGIEDAITKRPFNADAFGLQTALLTEVICHAAQHLVVSPL